MKSNDLLFNRCFIPQPFASADTASKNSIDSYASNNINFPNGFPSVYSTPPSLGGKLVQRGDMNTIGNLATHNQFYRMMGGIYSFDPELAIVQGGYPKGATLEGISGLNYFRVISLVDDNMVDFRNESTEDQIARSKIQNPNNPLVNGSVDGIHWAYCERGTVPDIDTICNLPTFSWAGGTARDEDVFMIGVFRATRNGILNLNGTYSFSSTQITILETEVSGGFGLILCEDSNTPWSQKGKVFYSRGSWITEVHGTNSISYSPDDLSIVEVTKGNLYTIYIVNLGATVSSSQAKVVII